MTQEEKRKAIVTRFPFLADYTDFEISRMVIMSYVDVLVKLGVFTGGDYDISEMGGKVIAMCQEFDWQPTDEEIATFVQGFVHKRDQKQFSGFLRDFRDDKDELLGRLAKFRKDKGL